MTICVAKIKNGKENKIPNKFISHKTVEVLDWQGCILEYVSNKIEEMVMKK